MQIDCLASLFDSRRFEPVRSLSCAFCGSYGEGCFDCSPCRVGIIRETIPVFALTQYLTISFRSSYAYGSFLRYVTISKVLSTRTSVGFLRSYRSDSILQVNCTFSLVLLFGICGEQILLASSVHSLQLQLGLLYMLSRVDLYIG